MIDQSIVYYDTFYELTDHTDIVIIGKALKAIETLNAARAPGEAAKPDPDHYGIGEISQVEVEEYQQGDGPKTLYVLLARGLTSIKDGQEPSTSGKFSDNPAGHRTSNQSHMAVAEGEIHVSMNW